MPVLVTWKDLKEARWMLSLNSEPEEAVVLASFAQASNMPSNVQQD
jgi:uncharacterized protein VirK/YbjX